MAIFKKQILRFGKWLHPNAPDGKLDITRDYVNQLVDNYKKSPFVPITRGHQDQETLETNPSLIVTNNIKSLEADDEGLNATFDLDADELNKYNDVSVSVDPFYTDHETGDKLGAMLKHVALVTNPYIKGLNPFTQMGEAQGYLINLSEIKVVDAKIENTEPEKIETETQKVEVEVKPEEVIAGPEITPNPKTEEVEEVIAEVVTEPIEPVKEEVVDASEVERLRKKILELEEKDTQREKEMSLKEAEADYNILLSAGKIIPVLKESYLKLSEMGTQAINLSDGSQSSVKQVVKELFEKMPTLVEFGERGRDLETGELGTSKFKSEMRASHKEMTDEQFEAWYQKNEKVIDSAKKKYSKK